LADRAGQAGGVHLRSLPEVSLGTSVRPPVPGGGEPWVRWAVRTLGRKFATSALGRVVSVRLTEFRGLMQLQFGSTRAPSVARDHVFSALGGLTADEALAAGEDPKTVWAAVCDAFDVSDTLRYGLPD
jgi:Protein of unknown function (DUF3046)